MIQNDEVIASVRQQVELGIRSLRESLFRLSELIFVLLKLFILLLHNFVQLFQSYLVLLLHIQYLFLQLFSLRMHILIHDLLHFFPLRVELRLNLDNLLVRMPDCLTRGLKQERVS